MSTPVKVVGFLLGLAVAFVAALGLGSLVGPFEESAASHDVMDSAHGADADGHAEVGGEVGLPGGLAVSEGGYTLRLESATAPAGRAVPLRFTVEGPGGAPVTAYDVDHEKRLHLIVVRRDLTGFQHVHPELAADGTWSVPVDLRPGDWRVLADFDPTGGVGTTLGADLAVAGDYRPAEPAAETTTARVGDYTVTLDGDLVAGEASTVTLTVTRDGEPVTDLQPYLGAYGHLVALREGDLAYLHVHPEDSETEGGTAGPGISFVAEVPTAGRYRLFLDFRHGDVVRTAELAVSTHDH